MFNGRKQKRNLCLMIVFRGSLESIKIYLSGQSILKVYVIKSILPVNLNLIYEKIHKSTPCLQQKRDTSDVVFYFYHYCNIHGCSCKTGLIDLAVEIPFQLNFHSVSVKK